jgi:hypothetical protein
MSIECFLIEPIWEPYSAEAAAAGFHNKYEDWRPGENVCIAGWRRVDTGEERKHNNEFGVGAMWFAYWQVRNRDWSNETGPHLHVRCPNGPDGTRDWDIDSRCSNCALPNDKLHRCWIRHGEPPNITVDKSGLTCSAGAGSIALPKWHGFLRGGRLVE